MNELTQAAIQLLKELIATPSISREEEKTANLIQTFLEKNGVLTHRIKHNIWAQNKNFNPALPSILLNSHHDTVKPNAGYTKDPFMPIVENGILYGLGSNDAGGCLVSLIVTFLYFYDKENLPYNLILAATAEEEISGPNGVVLTIPELGPIDFAIVGEPTEMNVAIAEKGLIVIDGLAKGKSGHAAREEGINALYIAVEDIKKIKDFEFPKLSETLGKVKASVTLIQSGTQHNVVPDTCTFTIDVRSTDAYSNEEIISILNEMTVSELTPRSLRLQPSGISKDHPFIQVCAADGAELYGSPTLSDQALMRFTSLKMGPGKSERSHTADEFIYISEIEDGIKKYIQRLEKLFQK